MKVIKLANPRGFCAGVDRAIDIVSIALEKFGAPIYVRHEVVHNRKVVEDLKRKGAIFVKELSEIPEDGITVFSAHGVSEKVELDAYQRKLKFFDATCPLVSKVHKEVIRFGLAGKDIVMIGHKNHPEVEGTLGRFPEKSTGNMYLVENLDQAKTVSIEQPENLYLVTQTTLSVSDTEEIISELKKRFPSLQEPNSEDICYATQNRQDAVKQLALETQLILVVGSENSSNSNRLKELSDRCGCEAVLIDEFNDLDLKKIKDIKKIAITAGASAPENRVQEIAESIQVVTGGTISEVGKDEENIVFKMPPELRREKVQ